MSKNLLLQINARNLHQLRWQMTDGETQEAAKAIVAAKPAIDSLTANEMFVVIKSLPLKKPGMEEEMGFGVNFLHMLLDKEGPSQVAALSRNVARIVSEEEKLFPYDFDEKSAQALSAARKRHFMREFVASMGTGWFVVGGGTVVVSGAKTLDDALGAYVGEPKGRDRLPPPAQADNEKQGNFVNSVRKGARSIYEYIEPKLGGPVELAIGGLLMKEGVDKWKEKREEQIEEIAETVSELAKLYPELKNPAPPSSARKPSGGRRY